MPRTASCTHACWSDSSSHPWGCRPDPSARTCQKVNSQEPVSSSRSVYHHHFNVIFQRKNSLKFNFLTLWIILYSGQPQTTRPLVTTEMYFLADFQTKNKYKGSLTLSLSHSLTLSHHGFLLAELKPQMSSSPREEKQ